MTEFNPKKLVFTEYYRPKKISDMVGDFKNKMLQYLQTPTSIPNFLLVSRVPGTGKTTLAKCIMNELDLKNDCLILNSSSDRGIETVREKVKQFSMTKCSKEGYKRMVFMDEADGMLPASQDALRNTMETYANNVFFILTANNINKISEAIKSRCITLTFSNPNKEEIMEYLISICTKEEMRYSLEGIKKIVDDNYPSIRNCVLCLQDLKTENKDVTVQNIKAVNTVFVELWNDLKQRNMDKIRMEIMSSTIEPRELNTYFWLEALKINDIKILQVCCRNEKDIANGADSKVIFITSLLEMIK